MMAMLTSSSTFDRPPASPRAAPTKIRRPPRAPGRASSPISHRLSARCQTRQPDRKDAQPGHDSEDAAGIASNLTCRAQKWDLALTFIDLSSGGIHPSIFDLPSHSSMEAVADSLLVHSDHSERRAETRAIYVANNYRYMMQITMSTDSNPLESDAFWAWYGEFGFSEDFGT